MPMTVSEFTRLLLLLRIHDESRKMFLNSSKDFLPSESWDKVIAPAFNSLDLCCAHSITTQLLDLVALPTPLRPEAPPLVKKDGQTLRKTLQTFRNAFTAALLMCDKSPLAVDSLRTYFYLVGFDLLKPLTACFLIAAYMIGLENEDESKTDFPLLRKLCTTDLDHSDQHQVVHSTLFIIHDAELSQYSQGFARNSYSKTGHLSKGSTSFSYSTFLDDENSTSKENYSYIGEAPQTDRDSFSTSLRTEPTAYSVNDEAPKTMSKEWSIVTRKTSFIGDDVRFFEKRERLIRAFARASKERTISTDPAVQKAWNEQYRSLSQILFASTQFHPSFSFSRD